MLKDNLVNIARQPVIFFGGGAWGNWLPFPFYWLILPWSSTLQSLFEVCVHFLFNKIDIEKEAINKFVYCCIFVTPVWLIKNYKPSSEDPTSFGKSLANSIMLYFFLLENITSSVIGCLRFSFQWFLLHWINKLQSPFEV